MCWRVNLGFRTMEKNGLNNLGVNPIFFCEIRGCLKTGSRCLKADEAWEHRKFRKLTPGLELEVGEMKEPKYLALVNGETGTSNEESCFSGLQNMGRNCHPMSMTSTEHARPHGQIPHGIGRQSGGQVVTAPSWGTHALGSYG